MPTNDFDNYTDKPKCKRIILVFKTGTKQTHNSNLNLNPQSNKIFRKYFKF